MKKAPHKITAIKFNPDKFNPEHSLLLFAEWFSSNYKKLPEGHYHSDPLGYSVKYLNRLRAFNGDILPTLSRISNMTGIIEIDRTEFVKNKKLTENYIFYQIIWCVIKRKLYNDWAVDSNFEADRIAIQYYVENQPSRSKKDILIGMLVQAGRSVDSVSMKDRHVAIRNQLLKAQKKQDGQAKLLLARLKNKNKKIMKSSQELLKLTIEKGIASVRSDSDMKPHEVEGSINGFEACRYLDVSTPDAMVELLHNVRKETEEAFHISHEHKMSLSDYWRIRYKEIQIEYVFEIMKFAWIQAGHNIATVSALSEIKFHEIISNK